MTVDTTVTNGRFVSPDGVAEHAISIHNGIVQDSVEFDDVWRTIDASGHLVLPGMIQPGSLADDDVLQLAQGGSTVVTLLHRHDGSEPEIASPVDFLPCIALDNVGNASDLSFLLSSGYRAVSARTPRPDLSDTLTGTIVRVVITPGSEVTDSAWSWIDLGRNKLVLPATHPEAPTMARDGHAMLEIPVSTLAESDAAHIWELVADAALPIHVTNGGVADFPLLPFLFHEGCQARRLSLSRIAAVTSTIPSQWYGLSPHKGTVRPGSHGDVVVFDPETPDPYRDSQWPGRVIFSIQRGNILLYNGQLHTSPGDGLLLD